MSCRIAKFEDKKDAGGDNGSSGIWKYANETALDQVKNLSREIKELLKDGKIAVHSVMSIWAGSPFGAAEAFKMAESRQDGDEVETKFSAAVFDMIDILLSLQREDSSGFWEGGQKETALQVLGPLATNVTQLQRKLGRMSSTLESYSLQLATAADIMEKISRQGMGFKSDLKEGKNRHCYKFRKAVRHAWYSISRQDKKIEAPQKQLPSPHGIDPSDEERTRLQQSSCGHEHMEIRRRPGKNKSEGARNCKGNYPNFSYCEDQQSAYQRRPRTVPPQLFHRRQTQILAQGQPEPDESSNNDNKCVGDESTASKSMTEEDPKATTSRKCDPNSSDTVFHGDSQPFEVASDQACTTSYLQEYEHGLRALDPEAVQQPEGIPSQGQPPNGNNNNNNHKDNSSQDKKSQDDEDQGNGNYSTQEYNKTSLNSCSLQDTETLENTKEVVVVRSAVSQFAESEFGVIDSEDMEWLSKIQELGQTGHICADEIEKSERLKRQSIFMHCFRYRVEEILKDVTLVSDTIRNVERKWVDPQTRLLSFLSSNPEKQKEGKDALELRQLVHAIAHICSHFLPNATAQLSSSEKEEIFTSVSSLHLECSACHKSFRRFHRMVSVDTNFLRDLCLGFHNDPEIQGQDKTFTTMSSSTTEEVSDAVHPSPSLNFNTIFGDTNYSSSQMGSY